MTDSGFQKNYSAKPGPPEDMTPADYNSHQSKVIRAPTSTRPALRFVEEKGAGAVIKDYRCNGFLYRNLVGRFLVWREQKAYRRLRGLVGTPAFRGNLGGLALVIEMIPGRTLEELEGDEKLPEGFFRALEDLVERFHGRGVAHCDLKRAPNILVRDDGSPYIVDWSAAIFREEFRFFPLTLIYRRFLQDDLNAVTKVRLKYRPETVNPENLDRYRHRSRLERLIRRLRDRAREFLKRIA